jgi:transposase
VEWWKTSIRFDRRRDNRGRPWASNRGCFEGILWILQTGAAWRFLPDEFPSPSTCWRRLKPSEDEGVWLNAWRMLLGALDEEGRLPGSRKSRFCGPKAVRGKSRKE